MDRSSSGGAKPLSGMFRCSASLAILHRKSFAAIPSVSLLEGPFRTKNTTTIAKIVNYYAVVFLLRPPSLVRRGPFFERKNVCNSQENGVHTRRAAIVNHPAVLKILCVVNLLRVVFLVRRGPLGSAPWAYESQRQIVTRIAASNCPRLGNFKTNSLLPTRRSGGRETGLGFARYMCF